MANILNSDPKLPLHGEKHGQGPRGRKPLHATQQRVLCRGSIFQVSGGSFPQWPIRPSPTTLWRGWCTARMSVVHFVQTVSDVGELCVVVITLSWRQMYPSRSIQAGCLQFHGPTLFLSGHQGHGPKCPSKVKVSGCSSVVKVMVPGCPPRSWFQAVPQ